MKPYRVLIVLSLIVIAVVAAGLVAKAAPVRAPAGGHFQQQAPAGLTPDWQALLGSSDLVVRAHVLSTASHWDTGFTQIVSEHTVAVRYSLRGSAPEQLIVHTIGGTVPRPGAEADRSQDLSMVATGYPTLANNEELVLFLRRMPDGYSVAGDDAGKYLVENGMALNWAHFVAVPLTDLYSSLATAEPGTKAPEHWAQVEAAVQPEPVVGGLDFVYNSLKWPVNFVAYKVNVNTRHAGGSHGSLSDYLAAIQNAAMTWTMVPEADFNFNYNGPTDTAELVYNHTNEVIFIDKGITNSNGVPQPLAVARVYFVGAEIVESDIWINDAFDWDATGHPKGSEPDLQSVVLHEMGHWLSLGHDSNDDSIMYPSIMLGTIKRTLHSDDRRGIMAIYPCAGGNSCNLMATPSATFLPTPTPTFTPTPTLTPTPTKTPTPMPTPRPVSAKIVPSVGGNLVFSTTTGLEIQVQAPIGSVNVTTTLHMRHVAAASKDPIGRRSLEDFKLTADQGQGEVATLDFAKPMTMTIRYRDESLFGVEERSLELYEYTAATNSWREGVCGALERNLNQNRQSIPLCHLATFSLSGKLNVVFLPTVAKR